MAQNWNRPVGGIRTAGWLNHDTMLWSIKVGNQSVHVALTHEDLSFVRACAHANMSCWTSGLTVMTRNTKMMVPDDILVYRTDEAVSDVPPPLDIARKLAENTNAHAARRIWQEMLRWDAPCFRGRIVHPIAMLQNFVSPLNTPPLVNIGAVFAAHLQAEVRVATGWYYGTSTCRLGTTNFCFDYSLQRYATPTPECPPRTPCLPRGGLIAAELPSTLLLLARGCCATSCSSPCLLVAPREVVPTLAKELSDLSFALVLGLSDVVASGWPPSAFVLTTVEVARRSPLIRNTYWQRVVVCDWFAVAECMMNSRNRAPSAAGQLSSSTLFACETQLALTLNSALRAKAARGVRRQDLSVVLGVPLAKLGCVNDAADLISERTMRVDDSSELGGNRARHYEVLTVHPPTEEENRDASKYAGHMAVTAAQIGALSNAGRQHIAILPPSMSPQQYFKDRLGNQPLSTFVSESLDSAEADKCCAICMSEQNVAAVTKCGHWFCAPCIKRTLAQGYQACPVCRCSFAGARDVVATKRSEHEHARFLHSLFTLLRKEATHRGAKVLVLCTFGNSLERVARSMREVGLPALAWSGNGRQLAKNIDAFLTSSPCILLHDPTFLSLQWIVGIRSITRIMCVLPLDVDKQEVCCQLAPLLNLAPDARLSFVCDGVHGGLPPEKPCAACEEACVCPFLIRQQNISKRFASADTGPRIPEAGSSSAA